MGSPHSSGVLLSLEHVVSSALPCHAVGGKSVRWWTMAGEMAMPKVRMEQIKCW